MLSLTIGKAGEAMNWMQFLSSIIASIAWPGSVAFVAFLFRKEVAQLIRGIKKIDYKDATLDIVIDEKLDQAEVSAAETISSDAAAIGQAADNLDELAEQAADEGIEEAVTVEGDEAEATDQDSANSQTGRQPKYSRVAHVEHLAARNNWLHDVANLLQMNHEDHQTIFRKPLGHINYQWDRIQSAVLDLAQAQMKVDPNFIHTLMRIPDFNAFKILLALATAKVVPTNLLSLVAQLLNLRKVMKQKDDIDDFQMERFDALTEIALSQINEIIRRVTGAAKHGTSQTPPPKS